MVVENSYFNRTDGWLNDHFFDKKRNYHIYYITLWYSKIKDVYLWIK